MNIIGSVKKRATILVDDIVDSAGTLCNAAVALHEAGATSVSAYVTHGVLSGGAVARVSASPLERLVTTDSIQATEAMRVSHNIEQAFMLADRFFIFKGGRMIAQFEKNETSVKKLREVLER